ncbi:NUDIX hydrolase [Nocardia sp. NPDC051981]|uniref:NUDIX hydrolase n=1 Tax=Nocardia sp. NPDC051981 TaxID=3155417 RepID=UPI0034144850
MNDGWPLLSRDYPYSYKLGRIRRDHIRGRDGSPHTLTILENAGAVYVIPLTTDGTILLLRQYRQSRQQWGWELPAGARFDHDGDLRDLAAKELSEEAGATADQFEYLGYFHDSVPITTSRCDIFLAHGTVIDHEPSPGRTELITTHLVPVDHALVMARSGEITDGRSALCLLRAEALLAETGEAHTGN